VKTPVFEVYQDRSKAWRFRLISKNNRILCTGESFTRKADAERAVATVIETCKVFHLGNMAR
jgi:uncharacterized protein YegP (UPF0339 family)